MADELKPLALNGTPQSTAPASTTTTASPAAPADGSSSAAPSTALGGGDDVAAWIADHPEDQEFTGAAQTANTAGAIASDKTSATTTVAGDDKTAKAVEQTATTTTDAKPAAAAAAPTFSGAEKIKLTADGVEWTRDQIVAGLKERHAALQQNNQYREAVLGLPADYVAQTLTPILKRLNAEPETAAFIDAFLGDSERAAYLQKCAAIFDEERPAAAAPAAATPPAAQLPPETQRQITELAQWKAQRERVESTERINRELAAATATYPVLATDESLRKQIFFMAAQLNRSDASKGIPDAVALMKSTLDAVQAYHNGQTAAPAAAAATTVPALLGSPGASPTSTRASVGAKPDPNLDPVEDWLKVAPSLGYGS